MAKASKKQTEKPGKKENSKGLKKDKKATEKKTIKKKPKNKKLQWFIINTYSGHENRVATQLDTRIKANKMKKLITQVLVPTQDKIVVTKGKKKTIKEKIFPGYVLIEMELTDDTWHLVRNTEGVTGFVGTKKRPTPLNPTELKSILAFTQVKQASYQSAFSVGDAVKVVDGPFVDLVGSINEINQDKGQIKVLLSVFGRETPVVLDFLQVKKL